VTQLALFHTQPTTPARPIAPWVDVFDVLAARIAKMHRLCRWNWRAPTRTQRAQRWLRAARWWPAGSRQREDFRERAMSLIGQEVAS